MRQGTDLRRLGLRVHPERVILYYIIYMVIDGWGWSNF